MSKVFDEIQLVFEKFSDLQIDRLKTYHRIERINKENGNKVVEMVDQYTN
jgi:hypothetical protein